MKRKILATIAISGLLLGGVALTGCERPKSKWEQCLDAGGTPKDHGFGTDCYMPGVNVDS